MMKGLFELLEGDTSQQLVSAVFMTYGFDAELFEHHVLPAIFKIDADFSENERRFRAQITENILKTPITVMVDGAGYRGGKTFLYDLINVRGCTFHPKCYFLLYNNYLRIIIGSSNITKQGMCYNAEVFWHYDLTQGDENSVALDLKVLINRLMGFAGLTRNTAFANIEKFLANFIDQRQVGKDIVYSTLDKKSFSEKLVELAQDNGSRIKAIRVLSPFFESDMKESLDSAMMGELFSGLKQLLHEKAKVEICFPGQKNDETGKWFVDAPLNILRELGDILPDLSFYIVPTLWKDDDGEEQLRSLHAKIVEINFEDGKWLYLVGSPNFTRAAMNSKERQIKNVEVGVFANEIRRLEFPKLEKVKLEILVIIDRSIQKPADPVIFIDKAEFDIINNEQAYLKLTVDVKKAIYPFKVIYQEKVCYISSRQEKEIFIYSFVLGHSLDLEIKYNDLSFIIPIDIKQKYLAAQSDLVGIDFQPGIRDILSYYAGRFRTAILLMNIWQSFRRGQQPVLLKP